MPPLRGFMSLSLTQGSGFLAHLRKSGRVNGARSHSLTSPPRQPRKTGACWGTPGLGQLLDGPLALIDSAARFVESLSVFVLLLKNENRRKRISRALMLVS